MNGNAKRNISGMVIGTVIRTVMVTGTERDLERKVTERERYGN